MNQTSPQEETRFRALAETYFAQAQTLAELKVHKFATWAGIHKDRVRRILPENLWDTLYHSWLLSHVRQAMDEVYQKATSQSDFLLKLIVQQAKVHEGLVAALIRDEWLARQATLPTKDEYIRQKILATLKLMIDEPVPLATLTKEHVQERAGVSVPHVESTWFTEAIHAAQWELKQKEVTSAKELKSLTEPSQGSTMCRVPSGWIDLDAQRWQLVPGGRILSKEELRADIVDIAWPILREELRSRVRISTVERHYQGFLWAGECLGNEVIDLRQADLEGIQRAWLRYSTNPTKRQWAKYGLGRLMEALVLLAENDPEINVTELWRIAGWLQEMVHVKKVQGEEFLSEVELNAVLEACLVDVKAGIEFIRTNPNIETMSTRSGAKIHSRAVVHWAVALMILIMAFTGLRLESVCSLSIDDWTELAPGLWGLAWKHSKKTEEHVAVLSSALAEHLNLYVSTTASIREVLGTRNVFLGGNNAGIWSTIRLQALSDGLLDEFIARHHLHRQGETIPLNSTILRRTYATRALYSGQNIQAIQWQLGHAYLTTTLEYVKHDRFEHPAHVQSALDGYGKKALTLWQAPLLLKDLAPDERTSLLGAKTYHLQDVGLCPHDQCLKAMQGNPPPCSLCEHLVTGPEFLPAWEAEATQREQELQILAAKPGSDLLHAQMISQFERFRVNLEYLRERSSV